MFLCSLHSVCTYLHVDDGIAFKGIGCRPSCRPMKPQVCDGQIQHARIAIHAQMFRKCFATQLFHFSGPNHNLLYCCARYRDIDFEAVSKPDPRENSNSSQNPPSSLIQLGCDKCTTTSAHPAGEAACRMLDVGTPRSHTPTHKPASGYAPRRTCTICRTIPLASACSAGKTSPAYA